MRVPWPKFLNAYESEQLHAICALAESGCRDPFMWAFVLDHTCADAQDVLRALGLITGTGDGMRPTRAGTAYSNHIGRHERLAFYRSLVPDERIAEVEAFFLQEAEAARKAALAEEVGT